MEVVMPLVKMPTGVALRVTHEQYEDARYMRFLCNLSRRHHLRLRLRQIGTKVLSHSKEEDSQAA